MPGVVETTDTFAANQVITSTLMNNIIDQTLFTSTALANGTLALTAGQMKVATSGITSNELATDAVTANAIAADAVTTAKILDSNVTTAKIADSAVTTAKILDANITPAKLSQPLTLATAQNSTSGTSIDFTSIPSWVKRITVMLQGVSTSGTSNPRLQIGDAGGIETTGYTGIGAQVASGSVVQAQSGGFDFYNNSTGAGDTRSGSLTLCLIDSSTNSWVCNGAIATYVGTQIGTQIVTGSKSLSATLDRVRITTVNGTDTFDAGKINIIYE
jgi:hypothetical protein